MPKVVGGPCRLGGGWPTFLTGQGYGGNLQFSRLEEAGLNWDHQEPTRKWSAFEQMCILLNGCVHLVIKPAFIEKMIFKCERGS